MVSGMALGLAGIVAFGFGYEHVDECGNPLTYAVDLEAATRECDLYLTLVFCGIMIAFGGIVLFVLGMVGIGEKLAGGAHSKARGLRYRCPTCNGPMVWIPAHKRWFCQYCQRYG